MKDQKLNAEPTHCLTAIELMEDPSFRFEICSWELARQRMLPVDAPDKIVKSGGGRGLPLQDLYTSSQARVAVLTNLGLLAKHKERLEECIETMPRIRTQDDGGLVSPTTDYEDQMVHLMVGGLRATMVFRDASVLEECTHAALLQYAEECGVK